MSWVEKSIEWITNHAYKELYPYIKDDFEGHTDGNPALKSYDGKNLENPLYTKLPRSWDTNPKPKAPRKKSPEEEKFPYFYQYLMGPDFIPQTADEDDLLTPIEVAGLLSGTLFIGDEANGHTFNSWEFVGGDSDTGLYFPDSPTLAITTNNGEEDG